ncbi:protein-L-isoaspartate O-methyltransferase [Streptomyces sp. sk226]|uniref:protein-L-isoaspartate O-methyltransferase family protein n=1 Tax=Streptomyces sp. sk226 TaxID=2034268 RepID=UPI000BF1557A|nr:methyltransferase domain-containing protein [Streptomyces sp. sk226]
MTHPPTSPLTVPGPGPAPGTPGPVAAREAMVARLEAAGQLRPGPVREALLALRREVLIPQAYVRRSAPGAEPPRWDLLDWTAPTDRAELLDVLYGGASVLVQHDGEPLLGRDRGKRAGGMISSMSSVTGMTAELLQELDLRPGQRVLDVGTGSGVTAAVACHICGDAGVVTLDRDRHLVDSAAERLADLGFQPHVVCGTGEEAVRNHGPFERIFVSYTVERIPSALVSQLAPGGRLLVHVTTSSPSWPGLAVVERTAQGAVSGVLRAVEFTHRAGHGMDRIWLTEELRHRIATEPGARRFASAREAPSVDDRGFWLAADHLLSGLVRDFGAEHLAIGAPGCGSWLRTAPVGQGWEVAADGPRDIWAELQGLADRWREAGSPHCYRLDVTEDGCQRVSSPCGALAWQLPAPRPGAEGVIS